MLLFKEYTGCRVDGKLVAVGTSEKPIVFTSIHDTAYNPSSKQPPSPFDWNGILIATPAGRGEFANIMLEFSVYGIKAQTRDVAVKNGVFGQNGHYHLTVEERVQNVQDNLPFTFEGGAAVRDKRTVRISLLSSGIVLAGIGAILTNRYAQEKSVMDDMTDNSQNYSAELKQDPSLWDTQVGKKRSVGIPAVLTDVVAGLCLCGFGLTFVF